MNPDTASQENTAAQGSGDDVSTSSTAQRGTETRSSSSKTGRKKIVVSSAICALMLTAGAGWYCHQTQTTAAADSSKHALSPAQAVTVATATQMSVEDELTVTGSISAWGPTQYWC